jgi:hypothetical protein
MGPVGSLYLVSTYSEVVSHETGDEVLEELGSYVWLGDTGGQPWQPVAGTSNEQLL